MYITIVTRKPQIQGDENIFSDIQSLEDLSEIKTKLLKANS